MKSKLFLPQVLLLVIAIVSSLNSYSKSSLSIYSTIDSLVPATTGYKQKLAIKFSVDSIFVEENNNYIEEKFTAELSDIEADYGRTGNNKKTFPQLIRAMKARKIFRDSKNKRRLFSDLAKVSARLKLYPLAMQSFYQSNQLNDDIQSQNYSIDTANIKNDDDKSPDSEPTTVSNILESFEDNKSAFGYALIIHVKQPISGNRKAFTGFDNVGHMFITLIKYNDDNSYVSRSFGFYPDKNSTFSATPIHPSSPAVFKDDALHNWDETIGKFISKKRFEKIIRLLNKYEHKTYHLNQSNCTDFGLNIANIIGINIFDTRGKWPLGKGNNPANAGQSILEKKITNTDTENKDDLFIYNSKNLEKY